VPSSADQLLTVLAAANGLLYARQRQMVTVREWAALGRAVEACTGRRAADLLTTRDLADAARCGLAWDGATDGPLPSHEII
jgi:hypothetical protein